MAKDEFILGVADMERKRASLKREMAKLVKASNRYWQKWRAGVIKDDETTQWHNLQNLWIEKRNEYLALGK